jgi:amino acid adenylation domain-containing protein
VNAELTTLVGLLRARAAEDRAGTGYMFLTDGEVEAESMSFSALDCSARAIGARLQQAGAAGERVLLLYPPGLDFVAGFFGCLYAGAVAVPAYPPRPGRGSSRLGGVAREALPRAVLTVGPILAQAEGICAQVSALGGATWIATDPLDPLFAEEWNEPAIGSDTLAFLQYTSGSTAEPKGVMVSHGNLLDNQEVIRRAFGQSAESVVVGWLPLYHDMGLIGNVLQPLYVGARCVLLSPVDFLKRPARWLEAISRYRATTSGGPNFAYDLAVRRVAAEQRRDLDLSCWTVAFNGAEPVRAATLERFAEHFAPCGFRREAFHPCYGLAEATLFVAGRAPEAAPAVRSFASRALERGEAVPSGGSTARPLVGCGRPFLEHRVAIVDPESRTLRAEGRVGEIWVAGASVAQGYWGRPEESRETFAATLWDGGGPFLRTGDLGFLQGGELFVTGRLKDLIILRGRNHYPHDLEQTAEAGHPALRPGCSAAFSVEAGGEERLVIVCEIEPDAAAAEVIEAVRRQVAGEHEVQAHAVVLAPPGTVPKTSSGKIRRAACRAAFLQGGLEVVARSVLDGAADAVLPQTGADPGREERRAALERLLREAVARALEVSADHVDPHRPLTALGLDSLSAAELGHEMENRLGFAVSPLDLLEGQSLSELVELLLDQAGAAPAPDPSAAGMEDGESPLSHGQEALWFLDRLAPGSTAYILAGAVRLRGWLDVAAFERALAAVVDRHAALRTTFGSRQGQPFQRVAAALAAGWFLAEDASLWSARALRDRLHEEAWHPFDLENGPLLRVRVFRCGPGESMVLLALHHLVADLWSLGLVWNDLVTLYASEAAFLPAPSRSYADFVRWQRSRIAGVEGERLWDFWRGQLAGLPPRLALPTDFPRPPVRSTRGAEAFLDLPPELSDRLAALAAGSSATLQTVLHAAFGALLARSSGQDDLAIGCPAAGRASAGFADVAGYFVNPVVVRVRLEGDPGFGELVDRVRHAALAALDHQNYPFPLIAQRLQPERDPGSTPLFQVLCALQTVPRFAPPGLAGCALGRAGARLELGPLAAESVHLPGAGAQFDLSLFLARLDGRITALLRYAADLWDTPSMERLLRHFRNLLAAAVAQPEVPVSRLSLLNGAERTQLLSSWSRGPEAAPADLCLHDLVAAQAACTPEAEAVVCRDQSLTYRELAQRAADLARTLRGLGVGPGTRVGVLFPRGSDLVVSVLAVLESGGAYVPLDPGYPPDRVAFMLEDSQAEVLLCRELPDWAAFRPLRALTPAEWRLAPPGGPDVRPPVAPENLAYIIYTSGSTGQPKGVAIEHRSAVTLVRWALSAFSPEELAGVLAATSICFDLAVFELFVPLSCGGRVILAENVLELPSLPDAGGITLVNSVPSAVAELVRQGALPTSVRTVNLAGEPLPGDLARRIYDGRNVRRVLNLYGPTEDTTYSTWAEVPREAQGEPSIGRPIDGTRAYVLGPDLEPAPVGIAGELLLGGRGLARGYWSRPELTAERFIPDPFADEPGSRLYRTGDLARWRSDGNLEFLGRIDAQVKVRGFRMELGEIEAALALHPGVGQAAVVVREDGPGDLRLVAYFTPVSESSVPGSTELRQLLAERLPAFMIPTAFVPLDRIPRTPSGKIDRAALARLTPPAMDHGGVRGALRTPMEELLAGIWSDLLGIGTVGREDDFFALGGHSLLAARLAARMREVLEVELPLPEIFRHSTLRGLATRIGTLQGEVRPSLPLGRADRGRGAIPLSFGQRRVWLLDQLRPETPLYSMPGAFRIRGPLSVPVLHGSLREIVRRHEVLRTCFPILSGEPVQEIASEVGLKIPLVDLSALSIDIREAELEGLLAAGAQRPFDLIRRPLLRVELFRLGSDEHALALNLHHTVADGWSLGILGRELETLYESFAAGEPHGLAELPIQYADYAVWQHRWLAEGLLSDQLAYWRGRLADPPAALDLPLDRTRPPVRNGRGAVLPFRLPAALGSSLLELGRREGVTPFMILLAAYGVVLSRYTGAEDVIVGAPMADRMRPEVQGLIGLFVNLLALRTDLSGEPDFRDFLGRVRDGALAAYAHGDVPFEVLVSELNPARDPSRSPFFDVVLAYGEEPAGGWLRLPGLCTEPIAVHSRTAKFDLVLSISPEPEGSFAGSLELSTELFETATGGRMLVHLGRLLEVAVASPEIRISALPLLTGIEIEQILTAWNRTETAYPRDRSIQELFAEQVRRDPSATAVIFGDERLTYGELDRSSGRLARHLFRLGVGPEVPVGLCLERSLEMVVATLAILKAGGAYVPLDPGDPKDRLGLLLADSGASLLITRRRWLPSLPEPLPASLVRVLDLDTLGEIPNCGEDLKIRTGPDGLAYVMYTSGSTGTPKGVAVTHRGVVRLVRGVDYVDLGPEETLLQLAPISFDASTFEIWGALLNGGRLVVMPPGAPSLEELGEALAAHGVTTLWLTAGLFHQMADTRVELLAPLRQLLAGGDALSLPPVRRLLATLPGVRLVNGYGPTETTTFTCCAELSGEDQIGATVPIGRPISNTRVFLLDSRFEPVPVGIPGELFAAGDGLARGYFRRSDLTAERFVPSPFGQGERMYRTGDLARWRADGRIEFLGRADLQVKVRGFRIEPGEIETALAHHPGIAAAAVLALDDPSRGKYLVAYFVPREEIVPPAGEELRAFLSGRLPGHMVPWAFMSLQALPLTRNGKVDRRALASVVPERLSPRGRDVVAPRTPVEELLAGIWAEVLGVEGLAAGDDFFALGGHSLLATQVVSRIRSVLGVELPLADTFEASRLEDLARRVEELQAGGASAAPPLRPRSRTERPVLSFAQERLWFLDQLESGTAFYNIPVAARLEGPLRAEVLEACFAALADRHESLRTTFADEAGRPWQVIAPRLDLPLPLVDLAALPPDLREAEHRRVAAAEVRRPFDLARGPLVRLLLLRLGPGEHTLLPTFHHVIADGWSMVVLIRELGELYRALSAGRPSPLSPPELQFADFALWQREHLQGDVLEGQLAWWREQLGGSSGFELPADRPRPAVETFRGAQHRCELRAELAEEARALGRRSGVTLFMILLAAFETLLYRWTGHTDLPVGSPIANRNRRELEGLIGFLANTLVLRTRLAGDLMAEELLARVRSVTLGAYAHQELPFEKLVEELQPERDRSRNPLFQVMFVLQNQPWPAFRIGEVDFSPLEVDSRTAKFDLTLFVRDERERLPVLLEYATDLFDGTTALRFYRQYEVLLGAMLRDPGASLQSLPLLGEAERHQIAIEWSPPGTEEWAGACVHRRVEAQAARTPDAVAVIDRGRTLTYAGLDAAANRLAHLLIRRGVAPEGLVGICVERSLEMVVALLAVLKAGGALVALDPAYPMERLDTIVRDAGLAVLITQTGLLERFPGHREISLCLDPGCGIAPEEVEGSPGIEVDPDSPIYAIYTSGSTGQPKGILVTHRAFSNLLSWQLEGSGLEPGGKTVQFATFGFCVSFQEIFSSWCAGGALVLADEMTRRDFAGLGAFLEEHGIERLHLPFAGLKQLAEEAARQDALPSRLREVITAGEQLQMTPAVARLFARLPGCELHNQYGASETHVVSAQRLAGDPSGWPAIPPIGRPIRNARIHLLDPALEPAPLGVPAELYAGGACVPRCYLNDPVLTAQKLMPDPFSPIPGARMYRTGDAARFLADGRIEYHGRIDTQVKIRGYRVELGEIETVLRQSPGVRDAAVVPRPGPGGVPRLVAYVVPGGAAAAEDVLAFLRRRLPEHMIPAALMELPELPINANGKLDREALPAPAGDRLDRRGQLVAPRDPVEEILAGIWSRLLEVPEVGVFDSFFELGGHSLLATQLISRVRSTFQVQVPLRALFEDPTVSGLARAVEAQEPRPGHARQVAGILSAVSRMSEADIELALAARTGARTGQEASL